MDSRRQTGDTWKAISGQGSYSQLLRYMDNGSRDCKGKSLRDTFTTMRRMLRQRSIVEPTTNVDSLFLVEYTDKGLSIAVNISLFNVCQTLLISDKIIPIFATVLRYKQYWFKYRCKAK